MWHGVVAEREFHEALLELDGESAKQVREEGCRACGGALDAAHYARKPRGGPPGLGPEHDIRLSFCCRNEGCRKRHRPESVRFLGRKVYLAALVVVAAALQHGLAARRVRSLREMFGVSERTLRRWREWWLDRFARSTCWTASRGCFATPVDEARLPASLLERFDGDERASLLACLRFLRPASIGFFHAGQAS